MTVKRNIAANFAGQTISSALGLLLVPVYIRYLSIEAYALIGLYSVVQVWLTLLDLGMTPTLSREMARFTAGAIPAKAIKDLLRSLEIVVFVIAVMIAVVLTAASGFLANHWLRVENLSVETVTSGLSLIGVVVGLRFSEGIYKSGIVGLERQVWLNGAAAVIAIVRGFGAIAVLEIEATVQAFFLWQAFVSVITLITFGAKLHLALPKTDTPPRFSLPALLEIRRFAGGIIGISFLGLLLTQLDKLLLSRLLPLDQLGYYLLASTVAAGLYLAVSPIIQAVYPALVRLVTDDNSDHLSRAYHSACQAISVLLAPTVLMLVIFPRGILYAWSGDPVLADRTAPILALLAIGTFLNALMQVPHQLQLAAGWTSLALKMNIVAVIVLVPALLLTAPQNGPVAAAAVSVTLNSGYLLVGIPLLHRRLLPGEMVQWVVADVTLPALGAAAALLVAAQFAPTIDDGRLIWLAFLVVTGIVATLGAVACASTIRTSARDAFSVAIRRSWRA